MGNDRLSSLAVGDSLWSQSMGVQVMALGLLDTVRQRMSHARAQ